MRGIKFFSKTNAPGNWNIASYHDPNSITWSWILSLRLFRADEGRVWPLCWNNFRRGWAVRIPFIGILDWATQRKMIRRTKKEP